MVLELGDVVGDVIDLAGPRGDALAQDRDDALADKLGDRVAVRPGEVGGRRHRAQVRLSLGGADRSARELPVRQDDAEIRESCVHPPDVVGAHLMAKPARAGVDQER